MPTVVTFASPEQAEYIVDLIRIHEVTGGKAVASGAVVTLNDQALDHLKGLPEETDGHCDGPYIWIGGTEYPTGKQKRSMSWSSQLPDALAKRLANRTLRIGGGKTHLKISFRI